MAVNFNKPLVTDKQTPLDFIEGVLTFNRAAGRPEEFDARAVAFHTGMQLEELAEKLEAVAKSVEGLDTSDSDLWLVAHMAREMQNMGNAFKRGNYDRAVGLADRHELLDADVDVMVVTVGSMMTSGADVHGACREVNRANLAKIIDGAVIKDENGKIQKPSGWKPPDLHPFVVRKIDPPFDGRPDHHPV